MEDTEDGPYGDHGPNGGKLRPEGRQNHAAEQSLLRDGG